MRRRLTFLGATATVTGSCYLLELEDRKILVDCGLFQGNKQLRLRNWLPRSFDPAAIDAVILTHAHIDHSGYLPRLVRQGFKGRVFCSSGTRGAALAGGAQSIRIHGEEAPVRAEVGELAASSAHADADELLAWMRQLPAPPRRTFVTHGEAHACDVLRYRIQHELGWDVTVPEYRDVFDFDASQS